MSHTYGVKCKCGDSITYECFRRRPEYARKLIAAIPKLIDIHNLIDEAKAMGIDTTLRFNFYSSDTDRVDPEWFADHGAHGGFEPCIDYGKTLDVLEKEWGFPIGRD